MAEEVIQHENSVPLNSLMIWIHMKLFYCWLKSKDEERGKDFHPGVTEVHKAEVQPHCCAQMWRLHSFIIVCLFTHNSLPGFCLRVLLSIVTRVLAMCGETIHIFVRVSVESHSSLLFPRCDSVQEQLSLSVMPSVALCFSEPLSVFRPNQQLNALILLTFSSAMSQVMWRNFSLNSGRWAAELVRAE